MTTQTGKTTYVNEYTNLQNVLKELDAIVKREEKRHMMDMHLDFTTLDVVMEVIGMLDNEINYEPSDDCSTGEPPISASEMHTASWEQHRLLHS